MKAKKVVSQIQEHSYKLIPVNELIKFCESDKVQKNFTVSSDTQIFVLDFFCQRVGLCTVRKIKNGRAYIKYEGREIALLQKTNHRGFLLAISTTPFYFVPKTETTELLFSSNVEEQNLWH